MRIQGSNILVTGGAGFIGSHFISKLLQHDPARIFLIDNLKYGSIANLPKDSRIELIQHDLGIDSANNYKAALASCSSVVHLAAEKHNQSIDDTTRLLRVNVIGTNELFELSAKIGIGKIVFTSSLYVYGHSTPGPYLESSADRAETAYGISKVTGERILRFISSRYKLSATILRLFFVYGPKQFANTGYKSVIVKNFEKLLAKQAPVICGDGLQMLDYVYVDDVADALILSVQSETGNETYNIGSGAGIRIVDLVTKMSEICRFNGQFEYAPADWTHKSIRTSDSTAAKRHLGWQSTTPIEAGLVNVHAWMNRGTDAN